MVGLTEMSMGKALIGKTHANTIEIQSPKNLSHRTKSRKRENEISTCD